MSNGLPRVCASTSFWSCRTLTVGGLFSKSCSKLTLMESFVIFFCFYGIVISTQRDRRKALCENSTKKLASASKWLVLLAVLFFFGSKARRDCIGNFQALKKISNFRALVTHGQSLTNTKICTPCVARHDLLYLDYVCR
jgi:hypothetical protein